ncbi:MAG: ABC transporter ATP-binding protein [Cyanobacterium sp. T60_A2020_053]|nr:ABC transporter ATP-binding protein [Cyanobacterium sp. T60_A2020_053]
MQSNFIRKIAEGKPKDFTIEANSFSLIKHFSSYLLKYKLLLFIGSILIFIGSFIQVLIPQITRYFIDVIIPNKRFDLIPWLGGGIAITALIIGGLNFARSYISSLVGQRIIFDLRANLYEHLQYLSLSFFENQRTGALMGKVIQDVEAVEKLITTEVVEIIAEIFTFVVVVSYLFYADWKVTILILITLPIMIYLTQVLGSTIRSAY